MKCVICGGRSGSIDVCYGCKCKLTAIVKKIREIDTSTLGPIRYLLDPDDAAEYIKEVLYENK